MDDPVASSESTGNDYSEEAVSYTHGVTPSSIIILIS
jgi:hypothetical protein